MSLLEKLKRFRLRGFDRSDQLPNGERTVENDDAGAHTINPNPMAGGGDRPRHPRAAPEDGRCRRGHGRRRARERDKNLLRR